VSIGNGSYPLLLFAELFWELAGVCGEPYAMSISG